MRLSRDKSQLCSIQGRLFELAVSEGYDCASFVRAFMHSRCALALDDTYDRLQWAGEEYILEELNDEVGGLRRTGDVWPSEAMYWMGYVYRFWHYLTDEMSAKIEELAPGELMLACYPGYHTLAVEMAVERLLEAAECQQ